MSDKRVKLTPEQKEEIAKKYAEGGISKYRLAKDYGVSNRTIDFIVNPEKLKENREAAEKRGGWRQYYTEENKAKRNAYKRNKTAEKKANRDNNIF